MQLGVLLLALFQTVVIHRLQHMGEDDLVVICDRVSRIIIPVLIYPAWLVQKGTTLITDLTITSNTPPMFMAHAANDPVTCLSSVGLFAALKAKNVPAELHVFSSGGHGFGGRKTGAPTDAWKPLCKTWMQNQGWLTP